MTSAASVSASPKPAQTRWAARGWAALGVLLAIGGARAETGSAPSLGLPPSLRALGAEVAAGWRAIRVEDWATARDALAAVPARAAGHPHAAWLDLMLGVAAARALESGRVAGAQTTDLAASAHAAAETLMRAASRLMDLADYARFRAARALFAVGEHAAAAREAGQVGVGSRLAEAADALTVEALIAAGEPAYAAARLEPWLRSAIVRPGGGTRALRWAALAAQAADAAGDPARAAALRRWGALRAGEGAPEKYVAEGEGPHERLMIGAGALDRGRAGEAEAHALAALSALGAPEWALTPGGDAWCAAWWLLARSRTRSRRHADAAPAYERVIEDCPHDGAWSRAVLAAGRAWYSAGDPDAALRVLEAMTGRWPPHARTDEALWVRARVLAASGAAHESEDTLLRLLHLAPDGRMAAPARWLLQRSRLAAGDWSGAAQIDAAHTERDRGERGRTQYFRGRALAALGLWDAAEEAWQEVLITAPMSYYALLALNRLLEHAPERLDARWAAAAVTAPPVPAPETIGDPDFRAGVALLALGLTSDAWVAFRAARDRVGARDGLLWEIAGLYERAGHAGLARRILTNEAQSWAGPWPLPNDPALSALYPRKYEAVVERWAKRNGLSPMLLYGVIREESRFVPGLESWAHACGLMQLRVATAQDAARAEGLRMRLDCRRLMRPELNIRLGARHLADLEASYQRHPGVVAAAYHAGSGSVRRWLRERGDLPFDLWVEDIPFVQTRHYIKRVLVARWAYLWQATSPDAPIAARTLLLPNTLPSEGLR